MPVSPAGPATDLQELEVDVREAARPQLHLQRAECGEQLQGDDGAQARAHGCHTLDVLQLPQPQAPDGCCVDVLVLPPAGVVGERRRSGGCSGAWQRPQAVTRISQAWQLSELLSCSGCHPPQTCCF